MKLNNTLNGAIVPPVGMSRKSQNGGLEIYPPKVDRPPYQTTTYLNL